MLILCCICIITDTSKLAWRPPHTIRSLEMLKRSIPLFFSVALTATVGAGAASADNPTEIGYIDLTPDITLRRMVVAEIHAAN